MRNPHFGVLVREGLASVAHRQQKTRLAVEQDMTCRLRAVGHAMKDATVAGWCRGFVPNPHHVLLLVRYCIEHGRVDRAWADSVLRQGQVPERARALDQLLTGGLGRSEMASQDAAQIQHWIEDPALPLAGVGGRTIVGRADVLADLRHRLLDGSGGGVVALHGMAGIGKTTLAIELAHDHRVHDRYPDGVLWAGLGPHPNTSEILTRWGRVLGVPQEEVTEAGSRARPVEGLTRTIRLALEARRILIVLDDVWRAEDVRPCLVGGTRAGYVLTTRMAAAGLALAGAQTVHLHELDTAAGVQLLEQIAPSFVAHMAHMAQPWDVLSAVVTAAGGLPLALVLIGAQLQAAAYSGQPRRVTEALDRMLRGEGRQRFGVSPGVLQDGGRESGGHRRSAGDGRDGRDGEEGRPEGNKGDGRSSEGDQARARSVLACIDASYRAVSPRARSLLVALSLFPPKPNTFSEDVALAVGAAEPRVLDTLVDSSLVEAVQEGRYALHQCIAEYVCAKRHSARADARFADYYRALLEKADGDDARWEREGANIRAAYDIAEQMGLHDRSVRLAVAYAPFLVRRGMYELAASQLRRAVEIARTTGQIDLLTRALLLLARVKIRTGQVVEAEELVRDARDLLASPAHGGYAEQAGHGEQRSGDMTCSVETDAQRPSPQHVHREHADVAGMDGDAHRAEALDLLGVLLRKRGAIAEAEAVLTEGLMLARQRDDRERLCSLLTNLGSLYAHCGTVGQAELCYLEGLHIAQEMAYVDRVCLFLQGLGALAGVRGEYEHAQRYLEEGLALVRTQNPGRPDLLGGLLANLGTLARDRGEVAVAERYFTEGLALARETGARESECGVLSRLGGLLMEAGRYDEAEASLQEGVQLAERLGLKERAAAVRQNLSELARRRERYEEAETHAVQGLRLARELQHRRLESGLQTARGLALLASGRLAEAEEAVQEGRMLAESAGDRVLHAEALFALAQVAAAAGQERAEEAQVLAQDALQAFVQVRHQRREAVRAWLDEHSRGRVSSG
ncbi:MAG TPA: NB-ARC domain-containing protein [Ktedonobacterales bacterium]